MSLQEATNSYSLLLKTIKRFESPIFRTYFKNKAKEEYNNLISMIDEGKYSCVIPKYIEEQNKLNDVLKRQTKIYNMYYDQTSNI